MRTTSPGASWDEAVRRGDFHTAWAVNDAVLAGRAGPPDDPRLPYHLRYVWDGRPFDGRDVLVRCYHGLGDTLQFVRYLPALRARAASVTLEAQPELVPLLDGLRGADRVIPFDVTAPAPPSACDIEVMELAHALRLPPDAAPPPYLSIKQHSPPSRKGRGDFLLAPSKSASAPRPATGTPIAPSRYATLPPRCLRVPARSVFAAPPCSTPPA